MIKYWRIIMKRIIIVFFNLILIFGCDLASDHSEIELKIISELAKIKNYLLPYININKDELDIAFQIRDFLYTNIPINGSNDRFNSLINYLELFENLRLSIEDDTYGHICGGFTLTYITCLAAFDILSRQVIFFTDIVNFNGHNTVEIYINNNWIISDPTFNCSFLNDTNKYINYLELKDIFLNGQIYNVEYISIINNNTVQNYYISHEDLMQYIFVFPTYVENTQTFPINWDGIIFDNNNEPYELGVNTSSIYTYLGYYSNGDFIF